MSECGLIPQPTSFTGERPLTVTDIKVKWYGYMVAKTQV